MVLAPSTLAEFVCPIVQGETGLSRPAPSQWVFCSALGAAKVTVFAIFWCRSEPVLVFSVAALVRSTLLIPELLLPPSPLSVAWNVIPVGSVVLYSRKRSHSAIGAIRWDDIASWSAIVLDPGE